MINEAIFVKTIAFRLVAFDGVVGAVVVVVDGVVGAAAVVVDGDVEGVTS